LIADLSEDRPVAWALALMTGLVVLNAVLGGLGSYVLRRTAESVVRGGTEGVVVVSAAAADHGGGPDRAG